MVAADGLTGWLLGGVMFGLGCWFVAVAWEWNRVECSKEGNSGGMVMLHRSAMDEKLTMLK
jgi:hypothetical protein